MLLGGGWKIECSDLVQWARQNDTELQQKFDLLKDVDLPNDVPEHERITSDVLKADLSILKLEKMLKQIGVTEHLEVDVIDYPMYHPIVFLGRYIADDARLALDGNGDKFMPQPLD